jgi:hypothetical protein
MPFFVIAFFFQKKEKSDVVAKLITKYYNIVIPKSNTFPTFLNKTKIQFTSLVFTYNYLTNDDDVLYDFDRYYY